MTQFQTMLLSLTNKLESNKVSQPFLKLNSLNNLFELKQEKQNYKYAHTLCQNSSKSTPINIQGYVKGVRCKKWNENKFRSYK